jgi:hypothetical protein
MIPAKNFLHAVSIQTLGAQSCILAFEPFEWRTALASSRISGKREYPVRDGRIVEAWNNFDFITSYQQIGMLPQLPV